MSGRITITVGLGDGRTIFTKTKTGVGQLDEDLDSTVKDVLYELDECGLMKRLLDVLRRDEADDEAQGG